MGFEARYDLAFRVASFDFFIWATHARLLGATSIVFGIDKVRSRKWSPEEIMRRYYSIVRPGAELMGLPWREGDGGVTIGTHKLQGLLELKRWDFPRIVTKVPPGKAKYTITLRRTDHKKFRNSIERVWREFAKEIGAHIIEDWYVDPITLEERLALYAGAEMNFGVVNGPMGLLYCSPYPMMMFDCKSCAFAWKQHGISEGQQLPFALPDQRLIWSKQEPKTLRQEFDKWKKARKC